MIVINAENSIIGRVATFAAKKALLGEKVEVVNCEKAIMTGSKKEILARYKQKREMGQVYHGPYIQRRSDMFVKRIIRGMLPYKQDKGRRAFESVRCYRTIPESLKDKEMITIEQASVSKLPNLKYISVGEICKSMGAK